MFRFFRRKPRKKRNHSSVPDTNLTDTPLLESNQKATAADSPPEGFPEIPLVETTPQSNQQTTRGIKERTSARLEYNLLKIRERVTSSHLVFEQLEIGSLYKKRVAIAYLENKANPDLVQEIKARIQRLKIPVALDASYIERGIEDSQISPFPQVEVTNRPDVVESALLQGRVAIMLEGCPDLLLAPTTLFDLLDTPEDAFRRWFLASSFFRLARFIMLLFALCLPGFYIALTSWNPQH